MYDLYKTLVFLADYVALGLLPSIVCAKWKFIVCRIVDRQTNSYWWIFIRIRRATLCTMYVYLHKMKYNRSHLCLARLFFSLSQSQTTISSMHFMQNARSFFVLFVCCFFSFAIRICFISLIFVVLNKREEVANKEADNEQCVLCWQSIKCV